MKPYPDRIPAADIVSKVKTLLQELNRPEYKDDKIRVCKKGDDSLLVRLYMNGEPVTVFETSGELIRVYKQGMWCGYVDQLIEKAISNHYIDDSDVFG